ncbi:MAG: hypothetical protein ABIG89_01080 [Candidatus Woesearchaeota archaeon]
MVKFAKATEKCKKCSIAVKNHEFCDNCFINITYRRLKKAIREGSFLKNVANLLVVDKLTLKLLPILITKPMKIEFIKYDFKGIKAIKDKKLLGYAKKNKQKVLLPLCLDDFELSYLNNLFLGKKTKKIIPDIIIPLYLSLTKEELARLAKLNNVKVHMPDKNTVSNFLDKFEKEFSGIKYNLKKTVF